MKRKFRSLCMQRKSLNYAHRDTPANAINAGNPLPLDDIRTHLSLSSPGHTYNRTRRRRRSRDRRAPPKKKKRATCRSASNQFCSGHR